MTPAWASSYLAASSSDHGEALDSCRGAACGGDVWAAEKDRTSRSLLHLTVSVTESPIFLSRLHLNQSMKEEDCDAVNENEEMAECHYHKDCCSISVRSIKRVLTTYASKLNHLREESTFTAYLGMIFGLLICILPLAAFRRDLPDLVKTPLHQSIILSSSTGFRDTAIIAFAVTLPILIDSTLDIIGEFNHGWRNRIFANLLRRDFKFASERRPSVERTGEFINRNYGELQGRNHQSHSKSSSSSSYSSSSLSSSSSTDFNTVERVAFIAGILSQPLVAFLPRSNILSNQYICLNYAQNVLVGGGMCAYLSRCNKAYWAPAEMASLVTIFGVAEVCGVMRYTVGYDPATQKGIEVLGAVEAVLAAIAMTMLLRCFLKWLFVKHIKHVHRRIVEQHPALFCRSASLIRHGQRVCRFLSACWLTVPFGATKESRESVVGKVARLLLRIGRRKQSRQCNLTANHKEQADSSSESSEQGQDPLGSVFANHSAQKPALQDVSDGDQIIATTASPVEVDMLKSSRGEKSFAASGGGQTIAPILFLFVFSMFIAFFVYSACKFPSITSFNDEAVVFSNAAGIAYAIMMLMVSIRVGKAETSFLLVRNY